MEAYYEGLLKLCGFSDKEIALERRRIEKCFTKLDLGPADADRAVKRVTENFDIELMGVRKILKVWLKELFDLMLAREEGKFLIYFGFPPFQYTGMVIKAALSSEDDAYVGCPEVVLCRTLGTIFDKLSPVLEAGEENGLAPGHAWCSLLQVKNGGLEKGIIPVPDISIATSYYCDSGPKADEFLQYKYGYDIAYVDSCLDSYWGEYPDYDPERVYYLGARLNEAFEMLKKKFGIEITPEIWKKGRELAGPLYAAMNQIIQCLKADPMPIGQADLAMVSSIPTACTGTAMKEGPEAVNLLVQEIQQRVDRGTGVLEKGAPRVFLTIQSFSDPVFNRLIDDVGLGVSLTMSWLPPVVISNPGPYETIGEMRAEQAMTSHLYHSTYGLCQRYVEGIKLSDVDGIINNFPFSCRAPAWSAKLLTKYLEKETGLPTLNLDFDLYDSRNYAIASLKTRLEAFAEILMAKKSATLK